MRLGLHRAGSKQHQTHRSTMISHKSFSASLRAAHRRTAASAGLPPHRGPSSSRFSSSSSLQAIRRSDAWRGRSLASLRLGSIAAAGAAAPGAAEQQHAGPKTLTQHLQSSGAPASMVLLMGALQTATKVIASRVARAGLEQLGSLASSSGPASGDRDAQKELDVVANEVLKEVLAASGQVGVMMSEEEDEVVVVDGNNRSKYVVVFDPLDGSSNISASIPTGTIFGVFKRTASGSPTEDVLQPGTQLVAAGYSLYSSATMMVISTGSGTHGFTLDPSVGEFLLSHPSIKVPERGQIYSLNDARQFDWPPGLQKYIDDVRQGKGQSGKQYSARYICSLVADLHRTLLYGGWAGNPRSHLRLVYEANPLSYLTEQAGGKGSTGTERVLAIQPQKLHQRLPLFMGSRADIEELEGYEKYGGVQQVGTKKYEV